MKEVGSIDVTACYIYLTIMIKRSVGIGNRKIRMIYGRAYIRIGFFQMISPFSGSRVKM
jgi:hypothetical protein